MEKEVAIIHYSAPRKMVGGVELVIDHHSKVLAKEGYAVHLIYGKGGEVEYEGVIEHMIPLLSPDNSSIVKVQEEILKTFKPTFLFNKLKEELKNKLMDVIPQNIPCIVHNIPSMPFNFVATAAINELTESLKKVIFWLHDSVVLRYEMKQLMNTFPYTLLHYHNKHLVFVTPTMFRANQFKQLSDPYKIDTMTVIPNGIRVEEYIKIDETTKLLMQRLKLAFEDYIIVLPVRVTPRKNIELAIYVLDELRNLLPDQKIRLLITGPPDQFATKKGKEYMEYLHSIVKTRKLKAHVTFCYDIIGYVRKYENDTIVRWSVADIYHIADMIFIPSREEGFGLPVIEAAASRKPIFCSRIPPFQELMKDGIEGNMFDLFEDPKNIAFKIYRELMNDKVNFNFDKVIKRFEWDVLIKNQLIPLLK